MIERSIPHPLASSGALPSSVLAVTAASLAALRDWRLPGCLMCGSSNVIKSHTISKNVLQRIARRSQVWYFGMELKDRELAVGGLLATRKASIFQGLCGDCDQSFQPADTIDFHQIMNTMRERELTPDEHKSVFLWNYRAVLREVCWKYLHIAIGDAMLRETGPPEAGMSLEGIFRRWEYQKMLASAWLTVTRTLNTWAVLYESGNWSGVYVRSARLVGEPTVAACSLFSLDDIHPFHPGHAVVTVVPSREDDTTVLTWVALPEDAADLDQYLERHHMLTQDEGDPASIRAGISRQLLQDIDCLAISPDYWNRLPEGSQRLITAYFQETMFEATTPEDVEKLNLFPICS